MSSSAKAKERRSRRGRATKHQRSIMASQHFGSANSIRGTKTGDTESAPSGPSPIEQKMQEMRSKLEG